VIWVGFGGESAGNRQKKAPLRKSADYTGQGLLGICSRLKVNPIGLASQSTI